MFRMNTHTHVCRYGEGTEGFYNYLWEVHGEWPQYDIWITEYADTRNNYNGMR